MDILKKLNSNKLYLLAKYDGILLNIIVFILNNFFLIYLNKKLKETFLIDEWLLTEIEKAEKDVNYKLNDIIVDLYDFVKINDVEKQLNLLNADSELYHLLYNMNDVNNNIKKLYYITWDNTFSWTEEDMISDGWSDV